MQHYPHKNCAAFRFSASNFGELSNMNNRYPFVHNYLAFQSSEGLYQAMKYPMHPDIQSAIGLAKSGYYAKKMAYSTGIAISETWDQIKIDAMRLTLVVKTLNHHTTIQRVLRNTKQLQIVEWSSRDQFWGAYLINCVEHNRNTEFVGHNILGRLWTSLRDIAHENNSSITDVETLQKFLEPVQQSFVVYNKPLNKESVLLI